MTPKQLYADYIATGKYKADAEQALVMDQLERIYFALITPTSITEKIKTIFQKHKVPVLGLYLWGGVGIGKTWLMDIFCHCLPDAMQYRRHFHQFIRQIHQEMKTLQGRTEPLQIIARKIALTTKVLCLDEFFVSDIADAMILAGLLSALFNEGVTLITTANLMPDDLYKNGLQRECFLPAIALIKQFTKVMYLPTIEDYRLRTLVQAGVYYYPLNDSARESMRARFEELAGPKAKINAMILLSGRAVPSVRSAAGIVWFNFEDLCNIPRSQNDYIDLAKDYHTVLLSNVPKIQATQDNIALYFIYLIDILYDHHTKLIISAEVAIDEIYTEGRFRFEFERTKSRLYEMQSLEYLQAPRFYQQSPILLEET